MGLREADGSVPQVHLVPPVIAVQEGTFALEFRIISEHTSQFVPESTTWYAILQEDYPYGKIDIFPAKEGGITCTFPHQQFNGPNTSSDYPWRSGNICVTETGYRIGREVILAEPFNSKRLAWHLEQARDWIQCAARGLLSQPGDPFELPDFPRSENATSFAYWEDRTTFSAWSEINEVCGLAELCSVPGNSSIRAIKSFNSGRDTIDLRPPWGKFLKDRTPTQAAIWLRFPSVPILPPWQVPVTIGQLIDAGNVVGLDVTDQVKAAMRHCPASSITSFLVGIPIPEYFGGVPIQWHWQAMEFGPSLLDTQSAKRVRRRATFYKRDIETLTERSRGIAWFPSTNWSKDQLMVRGAIEAIQDKFILVIGVGAIGSVVAELLVRGGSKRVMLADAERFTVGNLVRHIASIPHVMFQKSIAMEHRYNNTVPYANVDSSISRFRANGADFPGHAPNLDLIVDCTGEDAVIEGVQLSALEGDLPFVSISLGWEAKRLFLYSAPKQLINVEWFQEKWNEVTEDERKVRRREDFTMEGIGCWHPAFPAPIHRVWSLAALSVVALEKLLIEGINNPGFHVIEFEAESGSALITRIP